MQKPLPIGISDFKELIEGGYAYVDKTLLIQEIVEKGSKVSLIPRLRRFGKTLNLSMLRYFTEIRQWYNGYRIGSCEGIYNPWSVLMCISEKGTVAPYWVNTSNNALIRHLIARGTADLKVEMEFKKVDRDEPMDLEAAVAAALKQIEDKNYKQSWIAALSASFIHSAVKPAH